LQIILLATVTTFLGNANPLLRFDGYYVFSDMLGVVNLQKRSTEALSAFTQRIFLGIPSPPSRYSRRERGIYLAYGPAAFAYKVFLAFAITNLVLMRWSGLGLAVGAAFCWLLMGKPICQLLVYLLRAEQTQPVRRRAWVVAGSSSLLIVLLFLFYPVSLNVVAPGVLEPGVTQSLRAPANGFVVAEHLKHGDDMEVGKLAFVLDNPEVSMKRLRLAGDLEAERIQLDVEELRNATKATTHRTRIGFLEAQVARIDRRLDSMRMRAKVKGKAVSGTRSWLGRYVLEGQEMCQIHSDLRFVRVVLTDEEVSRTRLEIGSVAQIQWSCDPSKRVNAVVCEIRRSASRSEVPVELTMLAGGEIYARPLGNATAEADEPYLHVFFRTGSVPIEGGVTGLTARVRIPARLQTLGEWLQRKLFNFYNAWKAS
ncbi:MAG: hypothetical protein V3U11_02405, partial [Planctomycetota bacterium]